ncbi:MAG: FHA domain-containing protein, partial [Gammaproteobacteria bacterium]
PTIQVADPLPAPLAPALGTRPRIAPLADRAPALWPWFAVLTVLTLLVLVAVVVAFRRVRQRLDAPPTDAGQSALAFLVMHGDPSERHVIDKTPWRIGRGRNNDLCIADHSVSRLHAEVRSNEDGRLMLHDLESLNGVFVNDNRIDAVQLREGDSVDIGDVRLRFTLRDEDYASEEPTVLVRTHTPVTPG